jgi:glycosyltransferase involved in cell wall biosynthesis
MNDTSASWKKYASDAHRIVRYGFRHARFISQNYLPIAYRRFLQPNPIVPGRVTVITATYNRPKALREAIGYVRAQTYQNWEQIIVSDGRDDRVSALVAEVGDPRIRSSHTLRFSTVGNYQKNYGLKFATGEFVLYFDDDNVIYPHCLETMVRGFTSADIGYVICPIRYGDTRRGDRNVVVVKDPKPGFRHREIDQLNYMIRRRLIERAWGIRMHGAGDFLLIHKIARMSRGTYLDEIIGLHT